MKYITDYTKNMLTIRKMESLLNVKSFQRFATLSSYCNIKEEKQFACVFIGCLTVVWLNGKIKMAWGCAVLPLQVKLISQIWLQNDNENGKCKMTSILMYNSFGHKLTSGFDVMWHNTLVRFYKTLSMANKRRQTETERKPF